VPVSLRLSCARAAPPNRSKFGELSCRSTLSERQHRCIRRYSQALSRCRHDLSDQGFRSWCDSSLCRYHGVVVQGVPPMCWWSSTVIEGPFWPRYAILVLSDVASSSDRSHIALPVRNRKRFQSDILNIPFMQRRTIQPSYHGLAIFSARPSRGLYLGAPKNAQPTMPSAAPTQPRRCRLPLLTPTSSARCSSPMTTPCRLALPV
jgi:hypothetical protein